MSDDVRAKSKAGKAQNCKYCGEYLGVYVAYYGDIQTCNKNECIRDASEEERDRFATAREDAAEDDYERYR